MDAESSSYEFDMPNSSLNAHIIKSRYVLFLGAGASERLELQPTAPFLKLLAEKLPDLVEEVGRRKLFTDPNTIWKIFRRAAEHYGVDVPDSEVVLDYLDTLYNMCSNLSALPSDYHELAGTGGALGYHRQWADMFYRLQEHIRRVVVQHYSTVDAEKAKMIYEPLIGHLCEEDQVLPIFTTNYDWVFEYLAEALWYKLNLNDGFKETRHGLRWTPDSFASFRPEPDKRNLVLFKLHGSTSWFKESAHPHRIHKFPVGAPELAGWPVALIYPTQAKSRLIEEAPYRTAYEYFQETMMRTELAVVIGFSFRDPAINDILRAAVASNRNLKLLVVEPQMNEAGGVQLDQLVQRLGLQQDWQQTMRVIKGYFGYDEFVYGAIAETVKRLDEWRSLNHWVEDPNKSN